MGQDILFLSYIEIQKLSQSILNVLEVSLYHPGPELRNCDYCRHGTGTKLHETIQSNTPHDHLLRQILRVGVKHRIAQSKRHG
jgi:hypothetical protein